MCSHYQALKDRDRYIRHFGVEPPHEPGKFDLWPGYLGSFIRRHPHVDVGDDAVPEREALPGLFGLVSHWSPDTTITRHTYNARSETVAAKPSFRDAWKHAKHCIIPAEAFYEPDWRTGKPIPTRIARADGDPMGIAGLWSVWKSPKGEDVHSYTDVDDQCRHASVDESLSQSNGRKKNDRHLATRTVPGLANCARRDQHGVHDAGRGGGLAGGGPVRINAF